MNENKISPTSEETFKEISHYCMKLYYPQ